MELFILEHKKLWRKTSVRVSVLLCFAYVVIFGGFLTYQWFEFGSSPDLVSHSFDGYSLIRSQQEQAASYGGVLTDEAFQQMVADYQAADASGDKVKMDIIDWKTMSLYLNQLYPDLKNDSDIRPVYYYVDTRNLTGFYERRQAALDTFLHSQGQTGEEGAMLMAMNDKVAEPFRYEWVRGWQHVLGNSLADLGTIMAVFVAIVLAPTFSGEWHNNTAPLILTTDGGWRRLALAKILCGLAFAVELFMLVAVGGITAQLIYLGTSGWDMPIQTMKLLAVAPMNMLQAEIYEYAFTLLGVIGFAGVVMLLSSLVKSNFLSLLFSLAAVYGPMMAANYLPASLQGVLGMLPMVGDASDIFRTNTFHIFGKYIWSPYLLIIVPVLIGLVCIPFAIIKWSRRQQA